MLVQNRNETWDAVLLDALRAAGIRRIVLCPGGRNSLLSMMLHRSVDFDCRLHIDERSAGFMALGAILADGEPVAVCTTSGSAVANLLPALAEAHARDLPLILLSCDRPLSHRLAREPQTMPQTAICAPLVRRQLCLPDPDVLPTALVALRQSLDRILAGVEHGGPLHINLPQWGSYCATEDDAPRLPPAPSPGRLPMQAALQRCGGRPGLRGLILAGADLPWSADQVQHLADATGYPLLADITSGVRWPGAITTADALALGQNPAVADCQLLLRLGDAPVSPALQRAIRTLTCPVLRVGGPVEGADFLTPQAIGIDADGQDGLAILATQLGLGDDRWSAAWATAELRADHARRTLLAQLPWGEVVAAGRICAAPGFDQRHFANSLSVRYGGLLMPASPVPGRIFTARGVNGTDGTLGLILGEMWRRQGRLLALIGDQAFSHDLPALANAGWSELRGALCVMNNGGAGLFQMAPCGRVAGYERTLRNPPRLDLAGIAHAFGLVYRPCRDQTALDAALAEAATSPKMLLIDVQVPPNTPGRDLPILIRAMIGL